MKIKSSLHFCTEWSIFFSFYLYIFKLSGTSETRVFDEKSPSGNDYLAEVYIRKQVNVFLIPIQKLCCLKLWFWSPMYVGYLVSTHVALNMFQLSRISFCCLALSHGLFSCPTSRGHCVWCLVIYCQKFQQMSRRLQDWT